VDRRPIRPAAYQRFVAARSDSDGYSDDLVSAAASVVSPEGSAERIAARLEDLRGELLTLSHDVHEHPELGFEEHHAAEAVAAFVRARGIDVEVGAFGLPTAFRAVVGGDGPRVAILAEYDALPGIGHGCGHNVICASAVGAFLALAPEIERLGGSVELLGTPAEEGGGGKEIMARAGAFDGVDVAMMVHPGSTDIADSSWVGLRQVDVVFEGLSAHAAGMPFMGRNALDAVVQSYVAIGQLRQHMLPSDRIHGIITDGGQKPNIVPERAAASYFVRSETIETLEELTDRVRDIFEAAALATGTGLEVDWSVNPLFLPVRSSRPLALRYAHHLPGEDRRIMRYNPVPAGSTDMGNISVRIPSIHPMLSIAPPGTSLHTPEMAAFAAAESGDRGVIEGALAMAATAADYLADASLRAQVEADFLASGGVVDVVALDR
jgi:amidohydrolase